jgi:hypothetical protein
LYDNIDRPFYESRPTSFDMLSLLFTFGLISFAASLGSSS